MKMHGIDLIRTDSDKLCYTIRRIGVICVHEEQYRQREGLKPNGWKLLPEGCCDNKALIAHLVRRGGLSQDFVKKWEDGRTVFNAWW